MDYDELRMQGDNELSHALYTSHDRYKLTKYLFQAASDYTWKINERNEINIKQPLQIRPILGGIHREQHV